MSKCPKDGRVRPVYIIKDNKRTLAISDGKGNAYLPESSKFYTAISEKPNKNNLINPDDYEFERGLSGFDF